MDLVIIPFFDIKLSLKYGFRTHDAHIYEHLMKNKDDRFLIVNRPTSLLELLLCRKTLLTGGQKVYSKNGIFISQLSANVYVLDIFVPHIFNVAFRCRGWIPYIYQMQGIKNKIKQAIEFIGFKDYSAYTSTPFAIPLISELKCRKRLLDADDNFTQHSEYAFYKREMENLYLLAQEKFDAIVCTNKSTIDYFKALGCKAKLVLIPNGVDVERFQKQYEVPEDLKLPHPIVGYAGNMQRMVDVNLMLELADSFPNVNFVFIGNILDKKLIQPMFAKKNIIYLGDKSYDDYPKYVKNFDICSIPYVVENQHGGDPMKFYEYMAAQKLIISTNIGEIAKYHNGESIIITTRERYKNDLAKLLEKLNEQIEYSDLTPEVTWSYKANLFRKEL